MTGVDPSASTSAIEHSPDGSMRRVLILGTGLIGCSVGLALRANGFTGEVVGWDRDPEALREAVRIGAVHTSAVTAEAAARAADVIVLAGPVFSILEWTAALGPLLRAEQLVTDVGSVKLAIVEAARKAAYNRPERPGYLPGHPMAGKEVSGARHADAALFADAVWLFTPEGGGETPRAAHPLSAAWQQWVTRFGARPQFLDAAQHDHICAWVSHLPQMLATALSALYQEQFGDVGGMREIGGRAMREMTRLGGSPYSMWRDVAHTNTGEIAAALQALEQRLMHLRENLRTPELREEFAAANRFRAGTPGK